MTFPTTRTAILARGVLMRLRWPQVDWRAQFCRWQPYGTVILLAWFATKFPACAFLILAMMHWTALDALRAKPKEIVRTDDFIAAQVKSIEAKHRLVGDELIVTNRQIYRVGKRHYRVEVFRTTHDLEGHELA